MSELKQLGRAVVHPIVSWSLLATVVTFWHLPRFFELALQSPGWHEVEHACFFWAAIAFWWPVIVPWPSRPVWPGWTMIPYLLLADLVNTGISAVLSFSDHVVYTTYQLAPRLWGFSALDDQATAGAIMWVPGSVAFLIPAAILGMRALETARPCPIRNTKSRRVHTVTAQTGGDLLRMPILGSIFRFRYFRKCVQIAMFLLAAAIVADGLRGPQIAPLNLAGVLPWTYWRFLAVFALLAAGNLFCLACPFTLPRDLARKFLTPRYRWPSWLRSKWLALMLLATYLWAYEAFALWDSPRATAWLILGYFGAVMAVDMFFWGASFCKYVCPIGQFHFVHSLVSPLQVKVRQPKVCESCATHDCIRGNDRQRGCELQLFQPKKLGNFDCTFCLDCIQACPQHNVSILRVTPAEALRDDRHGSGIGRLNRRVDVAVLVLILVFGAFVNAAGMTSPVMMWMHKWHARSGLKSMVPTVTALYVAGLLVGPAMLVSICAGISHRAGRATSWKETSCSFTLALVPIGFGMWIAHFSNHMVAGWSAVMPPLLRLFSSANPAAFPQAFTPDWMPSLDLLFLDFGLLFSLYATWRVARRLAVSDRNATTMMLPWAVLSGALYSAGVWIIFQPMQMRGTT